MIYLCRRRAFHFIFFIFLNAITCNYIMTSNLVYHSLKIKGECNSYSISQAFPCNSIEIYTFQVRITK